MFRKHSGMYSIKLIHKTYLHRLRMKFRLAALEYSILNLRVFSIITLQIRFDSMKAEINLFYTFHNMVLSRDQNAGRIHSIMTDNISF